jgi:hypothetical protein
LLKQNSLSSLCAPASKRGCQHAGNCADADKRRLEQELLIA